ncbi:major facilitator superfamily domain-containing protein [Xylariaceae sp. FL0255]|nr:major facilitator superfamily domain-containing protein [Xylariaceae sp. FL0255]
MADVHRGDDISLQHLPSSCRTTAGDIGDNEAATSPAMDSRQTRPQRKKSLILLGACISQLPIWGFSISYGVFQEYYVRHWSLSGNPDVAGIIGTTQNGVLYLSLPFLFAALSRRWARHRVIVAYSGALLAAIAFVLSSFSTQACQLVATQGVLSALGCALIYSPTTLSLGEWFSSDSIDGAHRSFVYGLTLSCKNIVGSTVPFLIRAILERYDFRTASRIWAAIVFSTGLISITLIPTHPMHLEARDGTSSRNHPQRPIPWNFLRHKTFYIYAIASLLQSAGYGIPQTYLPTYALEVTHLSQTSATILLTVFNIPGIAASSLIGYLAGRRWLSASTLTAVVATCTSLSAFLLWGLTSTGSLALLLLFSATFGFFGGGYSATWGGIVNELENEAAHRNEPVDPGMIYGMLNGARGIGYVSGGLASVPLLKIGGLPSASNFGYASAYGPLILFTGLSTVFGGWSLAWKWMARISRL